MIRLLLLLLSLYSVPCLSMECRQCDYNGDNCRSIDCGRAMADPCADLSNGGRNDSYCFTYDSGRQECFSCDKNAQHSDEGNTDSVRGDGNCYSGGDLICSQNEKGEKTFYNQNGEKVFFMIDGSICTRKEMLWATAFFGDWTKKSSAIPGAKDDNVLVGGPAIIMGLIKILRMFDSGQFWPGINHKGFFSHLREECSMEYVEHKCRLQNTTHPCFKDWDLNKIDPSTGSTTSPHFHQTEEYAKKAISMIGLLNRLHV